MSGATQWVEVDCPDCGNRNRKARRECKRSGGMCGGTGVVLKSVPVEGPRSYPDAIESPLDPPTVDGTDVTRQL